MTRPPIALAYPPDVAHATTRLWVLPHPRTGVPTYFATSQDGTNAYELIVTRPPTRSWLLRGHDDDGYVVADGALRILSRIDPAFLLLGIFCVLDTSQQYWPLDDWLEAATDVHVQRRSMSAWPDMAAFVALPSMQTHLDRICATQEADGGRVYRLDETRIRAMLHAKAQRVCARAPEQVAAQAWRTLDASASDADVDSAQQEVARQWIEAYVPLSVRW